MPAVLSCESATRSVGFGGVFAYCAGLAQSANNGSQVDTLLITPHRDGNCVSGSQHGNAMHGLPAVPDGFTVEVSDNVPSLYPGFVCRAVA